MRSFACVAAIGLAVLGAAQDFPGAKSDPVASPSSAQAAAGGFGPLVNVLVALGIVYAIVRFALPKVMNRLNRRIVAGASSAIRIEESASFAGGSLYVVSARGKSLLLAVGTQGVQCLADLTESPSKSPEPPTFGDLVEVEIRRESAAVRAESPEPSAGDWSEALQRLERLSR
jgi:hypothetical protein